MTRLRCAALRTYNRLTSLLPSEFGGRYAVEMQLDFSDQVHACATTSELIRVVYRAYSDLAVSAVREWRDSDVLRTLLVAGLAHTGIWLVAVGMAAWQWPGGSRLLPLVALFAVISGPGVAAAVCRQRRIRQPDVVRCARPS